MITRFGRCGEFDSIRKIIEASLGTRTSFSGADMSKPVQIAEMTGADRRALGAAGMLADKAGIHHAEAIESCPPRKWNTVIAVDFEAAFQIICAIVPEMKARRWRPMINIASAHGLIASPSKSAYAAAPVTGRPWRSKASDRPNELT